MTLLANSLGGLQPVLKTLTLEPEAVYQRYQLFLAHSFLTYNVRMAGQLIIRKLLIDWALQQIMDIKND